jgi:hypothetical protein
MTNFFTLALQKFCVTFPWCSRVRGGGREKVNLLGLVPVDF